MARRSFGTQAPLLDFTEVAREVVAEVVREPGLMPPIHHLAYASQETHNVVWTLLRGASLRDTVRRTRITRDRVKKVVVDVGLACARFQDERLTGLNRASLRIEPTLAFRLKNKVLPGTGPGKTPVWIWTSIDELTALAVSWRVGPLRTDLAREIVTDAAGRLATAVDLTEDDRSVRLCSKEGSASRFDVDDRLLRRAFRTGTSGHTEESTSRPTETELQRPAQPPLDGAKLRVPSDWFSSLTPGSASKVRAHAAALSLHLMFHNFCQVRPTLGVPPAMAAGLVDHAWDVDEIVGLLNA